MNKEKLWKRFSKYIRTTRANQYGMCVCVTCGAVGKVKQFDAGHFVRREFLPTLFDERNVHPQCRVCNRGEYGKEEEYSFFLKMKYGPGICEELWDKALNGDPPDLTEIDKKLKDHGF